MEARSVLQGLNAPQSELYGAPDVCVAVLDGPVDLSHPCFAGADLTRIDTLVTQPAGAGPMSRHGTLVTSLIFGQTGSPVTGIAPRCRGLILPVFQDADEARVPQLDLARAIERAVQEGAHIVNISGGERAPDGQAEDLLRRALRLCSDRGVLVVSAAGNDGCDCLQVPAAVPGVLAVGATGADGTPLQISNWGTAYAANGVVAPGEAVVGAAPGGGRAAATGSSFATPLVAGVAALLVTAQLRAGQPADPAAAGRAILAGASTVPCSPSDAPDCRRYLAGRLNAPRAYGLISRTGETAMTNIETTPIPTNPAQPVTQPVAETAAEPGIQAAAAPMAAGAAGTPGDATGTNSAMAGAAAGRTAGTGSAGQPALPPPDGVQAACGNGGSLHAETASRAPASPAAPDDAPPPARGHGTGAGVRPSCGCGGSAAAECQCGGNGTGRQLVYAIGKLGFDFRTEARRDSFRQQMQSYVTRVGDHDVESPANPYDPVQLTQYLTEKPWVSDKVTWTLNMDSTPIYALEAESPVGMDWSEPINVKVDAEHVTRELRTLLENLARPPVSVIYRTFRDALRGQILKNTDPDYVSRLSIPGLLTGRTVRLYSGQVVPVVEVKSRGVYAWNEGRLVDSILDGVKEAAVGQGLTPMPDQEVRAHVRAFLDKVYYQFRNLGQSSADRALNFAGTNGFLLGATLKEGLLAPGVTQRPRRADGTDEPPRLGALDTIRVSKSPYCRPGSDCQDVSVVFFDPENDQRAKNVYQFTFDVSDELPVSLAPVHQYLDR